MKRKESRLAFRISGETNQEIEELIKERKEILDKSDFARKAVSFYIQFLQSSLAIGNKFLFCDKGAHIIKSPLRSTEGLLCPEHLVESVLKKFDAVDILNFVLTKVRD